ncbi:hypothetical protein [Peristeroidobacter soli]|jgi:hypothetical protein|uniref:hypothetical protein n=1 Tax=Peristeroidobacter soli TaxID=2497877 RepID=UPI00130065EE|nr:hypothetical protein [Peristeroidobacter soli]
MTANPNGRALWYRNRWIHSTQVSKALGEVGEILNIIAYPCRTVPSPHPESVRQPLL